MDDRRSTLSRRGKILIGVVLAAVAFAVAGASAIAVYTIAAETDLEPAQAETAFSVMGYTWSD